MKIAITGGSGNIGAATVAYALSLGHEVVSIDRVEPADFRAQKNLQFIQAEITNYDQLLAAFKGCDALIHLAAIPSPENHPDHVVHNNNVVGSYNALRAAVEQGIMRICQASSVNAIGQAYSRAPRHDYFPLDEDHPNYCEDPYSLSKWICEQQADSFARRYPDMRISSMRFHYVVPDRATAMAFYAKQGKLPVTYLWCYTLYAEATSACLLSLNADFRGHEVFYIVAPDSHKDEPSLELAAKYFPGVPVKGDLSGRRSFISVAKADRLLGLTHKTIV